MGLPEKSRHIQSGQMLIKYTTEKNNEAHIIQLPEIVYLQILASLPTPHI